jgi:hypothetical protein
LIRGSRFPLGPLNSPMVWRWGRSRSRERCFRRLSLVQLLTLVFTPSDWLLSRLNGFWVWSRSRGRCFCTLSLVLLLAPVFIRDGWLLSRSRGSFFCGGVGAGAVAPLACERAGCCVCSLFPAADFSPWRVLAPPTTGSGGCGV